VEICLTRGRELGPKDLQQTLCTPPASQLHDNHLSRPINRSTS
jgi:hypothetical protein